MKKKLSLVQLMEAVKKNDRRLIESLDEFSADVPMDDDADFSSDIESDEIEDEDGAEEEVSETVTVEIDPKAPLADILRTIADAIEGDEEVEDDTEDSDDEEVEDDTEDDEVVEDDMSEAEEDEESISDKDTSMYVAGTKDLTRTRKTPEINRKGIMDAELGDIVKEEGEAAEVKPLSRTRKTPEINRKSTADSRIAAGKRLTDIGRGK